MYHTNSLIPLLNLANYYSIPSDITFFIYSMIIHNAAQIIIHNWYNHISIHNINLVYIVNKLTILRDFDHFGNIISFYNLHDNNVATTFFICSKYIQPNISSYDWWFNIIQYAINGINYIHDFNDPIIERSLTYINYIHQLFDF